jgi:hypothetical protein
VAALDPCAWLLLGAEMEPDQIGTWGGLRWSRSVVLEALVGCRGGSPRRDGSRSWGGLVGMQ